MTEYYYNPLTGELMFPVPEGATIPDGMTYMHVMHGREYSLHTNATHFLANRGRGGFYTELPLPATPLLAIAHTDENPKRRGWMKCGASTYMATDFSDDTTIWERLIDPVEAVAVPFLSGLSARDVEELHDPLLDQAARDVNDDGWTCNGGLHEPENFDECVDCRYVAYDVVASALAGFSAVRR